MSQIGFPFPIPRIVSILEEAEQEQAKSGVFPVQDSAANDTSKWCPYTNTATRPFKHSQRVYGVATDFNKSHKFKVLRFVCPFQDSDSVAGQIGHVSKLVPLPLECPNVHESV